MCAHAIEMDSDVCEVLVGRQMVVFLQSNIWPTSEQTGTNTYVTPQLPNLTHLDGHRHVVQTRVVLAFSSGCVSCSNLHLGSDFSVSSIEYDIES